MRLGGFTELSGIIQQPIGLILKFATQMSLHEVAKEASNSLLTYGESVLRLLLEVFTGTSIQVSIATGGTLSLLLYHTHVVVAPAGRLCRCLLVPTSARDPPALEIRHLMRPVIV